MIIVVGFLIFSLFMITLLNEEQRDYEKRWKERLKEFERKDEQ